MSSRVTWLTRCSWPTLRIRNGNEDAFPAGRSKADATGDAASAAVTAKPGHRSALRESQDSSAHRSLCVPLDPTSVNVKSGVDVYVTRPTYNVVDGPAGMSVGNKIST